MAPFSPITSDEPSLNEVRQALGTAGQELHQLIRKPVDQRGESFKEDVQVRSDFIKTYDLVERALERAAQAEVPESRGPSAAFDRPEQGNRSIGQLVVEDEQYKRLKQDHELERGNFSKKFDQSFFQRALISEGTLTNGIGNGNLGQFLPLAQPTLIPTLQRRLFVRNLLTVLPTSFPSLPYIQELNPTTNELGASAVAEAAQKPEVALDSIRQDAPVKKIAAWIPVTTEILEDAPALQGYIEQRLTYMVLLREEQQILNGDGVDANIRGIRQTTGIQTQASAGANDIPATLALAIGKIENVDGEADGVVFNPLDYWAQVGSRHSTQFDNGFGGNAPAAISGISWGLPNVRSRSIERGKFLAGSWALGATLLDRQEVVIRLGEQHSDYFTKNKVVVLAEERIGLQVNRPAWFCEGTVTFS